MGVMTETTTRIRKGKEFRDLRFGRLADLVADIESFEGKVRTSGNWTPAQNVTHVALIIKFSIDGFEVPNAPLLIRGFAKMARYMILNKPMWRGIKIPRKFKAIIPPESITWEEAVAGLKKTVDRVDQGGERMKHRSPVLGFLEHEEWIQLHCRHAELHFGYLHAAKDEAE